MKKFLVIPAAAVGLMFTACTNDEPIAENLSEDVITYAVATQNQSRALHSYSSSNLPESFNLWAIDGYSRNYSKPWINNATIVRTNNGYTDAEGNRFWDYDNQTADFYALVDHQGKFRFTNNGYSYSSTPEVVDYEISTDYYGNQLDLMYAVHCDAKKADGAVSLNFRHALCQIAFRFENENPLTMIGINNICVSGIAGKGTYQLPLYYSTDNNITADSPDDNYGYDHGKWVNLSDIQDFYNYPIGTGQYTIIGAGSKDFNNPEFDEYRQWLNLIPQAKTAEEGFKFILDINFQSGADNTSEQAMYGYSINRNKTTVEIPANIDWKEGKRYVYTFRFNRYWTPEDPDLAPISYTVTCDDFITEEQPVIPEYEGVLMREAQGNTPALYFATKNLGAKTPEDAGLFFWWGDTQGHEAVFDANGDATLVDNFDFSETNPIIVTNNLSPDNLGQWIDNASCSGKLLPQYDAATQQLGGNWRMPTQEELEWLADYNNCTWIAKFDSSGDFIGNFVLSKSTGGVIYLPACGAFAGTEHMKRYDFMHSDGTHSDYGKFSYYWSSTVGNDGWSDDNINSTALFSMNYLDVYNHAGEVQIFVERYAGVNIRPCYTK